jgi:hypothetical protein
MPVGGGDPSMINGDSSSSSRSMSSTEANVVYDNDLEQGWSRDRENDGNTGDVRIFRHVQAS